MSRAEHPAQFLRLLAEHGEWFAPGIPDGFRTPYSLTQARTALLRAAQALEFEQFMRDHATNRHTRALTLTESFDSGREPAP